MVNNHFGKNQKLCSKKQITALFLHGKAFFVYPFQIKILAKKTAQKTSEIYLPKIMFSVSKKKIALAVNRNYVRRTMRETYRTQNAKLIEYCTLNNISVICNINYVPTEKMAFTNLQQSMNKAIQKITMELKNETA